MLKALEYGEKEEICGTERNSYFHTDHDATGMCLIEDYYSGLGSNMHTGYNVQFIVSKGNYFRLLRLTRQKWLLCFYSNTKIFFNDYGYFPTNLCANSGYGSYENYKFLEENLIHNYVKFQNWRREMDGKLVPLYQSKNNQVLCLNEKVLNKVKRSKTSIRPKKATKFMLLKDAIIVNLKNIV